MAKNAKNYEERPWGSFHILTEIEKTILSDDCIVKEIIVKPYESLSDQRHRRRGEFWYIVKGVADIEIDGMCTTRKHNQYIFIPRGSWHRVANNQSTPLIFIEITTQEFDENDIERRDDKYGRDSSWRNI